MPGLQGLRTSLPIAALLAGVDQISKAIIVRTLSPGRPATLIPGFFDLTLVTNTGGVFGIFRDLDDPLRNVLFSAVPITAVVLILWYGRSLPATRRWSHVALGLVLGGAVGNLLDRFRIGHVVDFLDLYVGAYHWPAFNLADSAICVGVAMLLLESLFLQRSGGGTDPAAPPTSP